MAGDHITRYVRWILAEAERDPHGEVTRNPPSLAAWRAEHDEGR